MRSHKKLFPRKFDVGTAEMQLRQLTSDDKIIVALYFYESLSVDEIGGVLQKKPETVQARLDNIVTTIFRNSYPANGVNRFAAEFLGWKKGGELRVYNTSPEHF